MTRGRTLVALATVAAVFSVPAPADAALRWRDCEDDGAQCARLKVPLDHSGNVPGSVSLRVLRARAIDGGRPPQGVALLFGGEPGEAATTRFSGDEYERTELMELLVDMAPEHRVVVFDQRGTGGSGPLRCRDLEAAAATDAGREAAACAALLGARRGFYRSRDTVADIEALRAELGVERLALVAVGYGAYVAQRYALAHPDRVERMVLDAPVDAAGRDPLMRDSLAAARRILPLVCRRGCGFSDDPLADVARLIDRMPVRGYVVGSDGRRRRARLTPQELLFTLAGGDADLFGLADFPAAIASALRGDTAPLFRLKRRAVVGAGRRSPARFSAATQAAVLCEEVSFPWAWHAGPSEREAAAAGTVALIGPELAHPFGAGAAVRSDLMRLCRRWPTASAAPPADPGPMPDVPVLVLAVNTHVRASLETARRTAARFPRARLVATPNFYGTPLTAPTQCAVGAVERFFAGRAIPRKCGARGLPVRPGRPLPTSLLDLRPVRGVAGRRGRLLRAVELTFLDWSDSIYTAFLRDPVAFGDEDGLGLRGGGLRGGRFAIGPDRTLLDRFEFIPGTRLSIAALTGEVGFVMSVDGPGRLDARLTTYDTDDDDFFYKVRGRVAGEHVRARLSLRPRVLAALGEGL